MYGGVAEAGQLAKLRVEPSVDRPVLWWCGAGCGLVGSMVVWCRVRTDRFYGDVVPGVDGSIICPTGVSN